MLLSLETLKNKGFTQLVFLSVRQKNMRKRAIEYADEREQGVLCVRVLVGSDLYFLPRE